MRRLSPLVAAILLIPHVAWSANDNSFHGVEPVSDPDTRRWLLLYDVYGKQVAQQPQPQQVPLAQAV